MKYICLLILSLFLLSNNSYSQSTPLSNKEKQEISNYYFNKLSNGALLVRLRSNKRKINSLKERGYIDEARRVEMNQNHYNREIISAFTNEMTFCDTYFFYSDQSNNVRKKDFSEPFFLDSNLVIDESIEFSFDDFLIAEFGNVAQDTASYKDFYITTGQNGKTKKSSYWGGPNFHFGALVVMTDDFVQLRKPFPSFVRTFDSIPLFRSTTFKVVARLNDKFLRFFAD